ncbi:TssQ family T6SS-associated lipoprotein [Pseudoduganella sp. RAF19]|uniref:TssQ family T6SS-associated lipoprotein n=1 Tax=Pseudoduganella sp. RAF19 TaxID=3233052 RepID=UPI003F9D9889
MKTYVSLLCLALLAACNATTPVSKDADEAHAPAAAASAPTAHVKEPAAPAPEAPPEINPARKDLNAAITLYQAGDYNGSLKVLNNSKEIWKNGDKATQLDAFKYTAFNYCLTNRTTLCRQQFAKAFKLDKTFALAPGEKGHPLWTPSYERARKETVK